MAVDIESLITTTVKPGTPPAKKPRLFRVACLSLIWLAATICALLFTAYPANASLMLNTSPGDQNYTQGTAILDLQLPAATGGIGTLTYTLTGPSGGALPGGLTFNADTRTLSGTPSTAGNNILTYTVSDTNGASTSMDFTVSASEGLALTASGNRNYAVDRAISGLELPVATGGTAPLTYTLTGPGDSALPGGLTFSGRTLSGTPSALGTTTLTYRVTDANGASTSVDFMVTVNNSLVLDTPDDQNYTQGTQTTLQLPATTGGRGRRLVYTLTGLPAGLNFDRHTRTLSGTPNTAGNSILTYRVYTGTSNTSPATFTITVNNSLGLDTPDDQNYTLDTEITGLELPAATGGTEPLTYTLTGPSGGALPGGLEFEASTRTLSGTPSTAGTTTLTYRVTDANGASTSVDFMVTVNNSLVLDTPDDQSYMLDTAIPGLTLPAATGGTAPLTYTLTGPGDSALPGGLTFSGRILSGTPSTAATTVLTYRVTDTNGASTSMDFMVTVNADLALDTPTNQSYMLDTAIPGLTLPAATGGIGPLTYTLTALGGLPAGLIFDPGTHTLSGTPSAVAITALIYTVTDTNGASRNTTFTVTVNSTSSIFVLNKPADKNYTRGIAITDLRLPAATGGTEPLTYTLTAPGGLPAGLSFNASTRILSGTPSTRGTTTLTYRVSDTNGASTNMTFRVMVNTGLALNAPGNQNYPANRFINNLQLPEATGGTAPLVYTLTAPGGLPPGLRFNRHTRTLSGRPPLRARTAITLLTYTVTDANNFSQSVNFRVRVTGRNFVPFTVNNNKPADKDYTRRIAIIDLQLPAATEFTVTLGGPHRTGRLSTRPLTYTLTGLPPGLSFNASTRTLSGTPSRAGTFTLTYDAFELIRHSDGQLVKYTSNGGTATFTVTVSDGLALNASGNQNYTQGTAIPDLQLPAATGGTAPLTYTLTAPGGLPAGLSFNANTRTLSGTPSTHGNTTLTYKVTDANNASKKKFFLVTVSPPRNTLILYGKARNYTQYEIFDENYTLGTKITDLQLQAATGGTAPLTYTLTNVPGGLEFDADTRTLSGTPSTPGIFFLTYTVTDANNLSQSVNFRVRVNDGLALTAGDQNYTVDTAIPDLQLPAATGGTGTLTYTLTGPSGGALPVGLEFEASTRMLSGTPSTLGFTVLTYRVTDTNGPSTTATFSVWVKIGLVAHPHQPADQNYTQGTAIPDLQLPESIGPKSLLMYTLFGLPADLGLDYDPETRILSGTPNRIGIFYLTYQAGVPFNHSYRSQFVPPSIGRFTIRVNSSLTLTAPANQNYTLDTAITDLTLPEATGGGTGTLTYTLTGPSGGALPGGLTFSGRTLSGTPDTNGNFTLTYTVTDANGASTSVDFMVNAGLALTASGNQNYTRGIAITNLQLPAATGSTAALTYTLTALGGLPAGLSFNASTRTLSGTPSTAGTTTLTYRVSDTNGASTNMTFRVTVNADLALTAPANQNYTQDTAITALQLPEASGGTAPLTYTLTNVPGLDFDPGTRTLSGTPSTATSTTTLTYMVTDTNNASANATFTVTVNPRLALTALANQNYTLDTAIPDLTLPEATGGTAPLTYTLTSVPGLTFTASTRTLSGTPDTNGNFTLTYTVTDANGASTSVDFMVNAGLTLETPNNQTYTQDRAINDLQLRSAISGTAPLTYTLTGPGDSALPGGLIFDPGTRTLSGTPSTAATTTLTYTVTNANGATTSVDFMVSVSDGLALDTPANQNYTANRFINNLQLPEATGGTGTRTYTLTGPGDSTLPGGLDFDVDTRTLSGTPDTADTTVLTYTVTDTNGASTTATFTVTVNNDLGLDTSGDQNYTRGIAINDLQLPEATGGTGTLVYTMRALLRGALPTGGLEFDANTRILSGTPSTAGTFFLDYRVTDTNGARKSVVFIVIVSDGLTFDSEPANQNYTQDKAITELTLPEAGPGMPQYTLTGPFGGPLPVGLEFEASTRMLSGTPSTAGTFVLTYTATNDMADDGRGSVHTVELSEDFRIIVNASLTLTAPGNQNYTRGTAISNLQLPEASGGTAPLVYTLTGTLPTGLTFAPGTRTLSGTPDTAGTTTLTYRVTDANGASTSVDFMVNASLTLETPNNQTYTQDRAINDLQLRSAIGGTAPLTYTLTGPGDSALPGGLIFDPGTRTLSGTPSTAATTTLTYRVTDTNGANTTATFTVTVNNDLGLDTPDEQHYTLDTAITDLILPAATGGTEPLTYTLIWRDGILPDGLDVLPPGLTFNPNTRTLSGTPSERGQFNLTYEVTDANDAQTSVTLEVNVSDGLTFDSEPANQNYTQDTAIPDLQLPVATGGTAPLTYTLTGPGDSALPGGLTFSGRILSGTPSTAATTVLTYRVTDTNGASTSMDFMVTVNADLALDTPANQSYMLDTAIPGLTLPAATGGIGPLTYTLTALGGLPAGLIFDPGTHTLSGTPSAVAITALIYTVTDTNGASRNTTFTVTVNSTSSIFVLNKPADKNYTRGIAITDLRLPAATGGTEPLTYTLTAPGGLPAGLIFNASTRILSGTPSTRGTTTLTYRVSDTNGASTNMTFRVMVNTGLALNAPGNQTYRAERLIDHLNLPVATGGTGTLTYTLTGLPPGLDFNSYPARPTLFGRPTLPAGTFTLTYTVTDANNLSQSVNFRVRVTGRNLGLFTVNDNKPADKDYTRGIAIIDLQLPAATELNIFFGGPHRTGRLSTRPLTYTLTGLPPGLSFNASTRTLSGTPSTAGTFTLTYDAFELIRHSDGQLVKYATGGSAATFTVTVSDGLALNASGNQNYTQSTAIPDLQLPAATGGTAPLTYTLTAPGGLPAGLSFNANTRTLSGTPSTHGNTTLTYKVTDANNASKKKFFMVTVSPPQNTLILYGKARNYTQYEIFDENYTLGTKITDLQLQAATGGTAPLTYTLTGPSGGALPGGLEFEASTRTLSGTPSALGTTTLTYTVTDANNLSQSVNFRVRVNDGLALTASGDQKYTVDTAIPDLQLPAATGGTGTLTYTLTGPSGGALPGDLAFDPDTRTLSGTPSAVAITVLTYTVTDTNGPSTTATFRVWVRIGLVAHPHQPADQNYTQGTAIPDLQLPESIGPKSLLMYTLFGLPADLGLDYDPETRILSGTPNRIGIFLLTYRAGVPFNQSSSHFVPPSIGRFTIRVNSSLTLTAPANQNYTRGTAITSLQLPEASGGTGTLTYTLTSVPGLNFNANTRILSGTPSTAGTTTLTYTVTDANGASTSVDFMVSDDLALTASGNQNYTLNTAIPALQLPEASGGTGTLTYTLTSVPGLNFNANTRILSGTPSTAGTTTLTYMVMDTNGASANATFTVIVSDGLALTAPANQNYTLDTAITALTLPEATGGTGTLTYTLTGPGDSALPEGLDFNAGTRILSGTPDTADTTVLTYTVTDDNGADESVTFTVIVSDGLALSARGDQNYTLDTEITGLELPVATGGTAPLTYTLTNVPGGLEFDADTRTLSGTPDTAGTGGSTPCATCPRTTTLTYEVMDANGASTNVTFRIRVISSLTFDSEPANQNYMLDTAITALTLPAATGGIERLTYTLTGPGNSALPGGLEFEASTRTLSGTPSTAGTTILTYTVMDTNNANTTATFTVIVNAELALDTPDDQNYTQGTAITALTLPEASGGTGTLTYTLRTLRGALPGGLEFDANTRILSGTPSTARNFILIYWVNDDNDANTGVDFTVIVSDGLALTASGNQNYTLNTAITDLQLPVATGGTEPLTYTLTGPGDSVLPGGLEFEASTRTLSGTPSTADTTILTYRVSDANNASTSVDFMVSVSDGLALSARGDQNYTFDTEITALELPEASGGTGTLTYTLTGPGDSALPGGLTFSGRILSGTPDTADTTVLTYTVTDTNGASKSVDFTVIVSDGLALTASGDQNYTQDKAITELTLPEASGGTGTRTYTLTGPGDSALPGGLDFNADTRILSGTPSTADTTVLTYTVTDANDASTTATFTVMVNAGLALDTPANQNYTLNTAITGLTLPVATGGTGTLTYTLTSVPGLTFETGTLSGTDTAATTILTYTVTDQRNTSVDFTVSVSDGYRIRQPELHAGHGDHQSELPEATGGTGTVTLTNVPGLDPRHTVRTPSTADDLTYEVTDDCHHVYDLHGHSVAWHSARGGITQRTRRSPLWNWTLTYTLTGPGDSALAPLADARCPAHRTRLLPPS